MSGLRTLAYILAALLALMVLSVMGAELLTIAEPLLKNYNEGWNAYRAAAVSDPVSSLYPAKDSLLSNNYPPLSFLLVAGLGKFTGDLILAGRMLAFVSMLGTGLCLGLAARAMGARKLEASAAALLFWAAPWVLVRFAAMDDPQMLGNLLDAIGLLLIVRAPRDIKHIAAAALFLTAAEFVKPLFITLPLALLIWLAVKERRSALALAGFGLGFSVLGYLATLLFLHVELLGALFSPRIFLLSKLTGQPGQWLLVEALPLLASLALFRRRESFAFFAALYAVLAFALAVFFSGGDGVSASQMMDVSMAVALGGALYLHHAEKQRWTVPAMGLVAGLQAVMLILSFLGHWAARPALGELMGSRYAARYDVAVIARHREPVLCESLALCYWAGKAPQVDAFAFNQAVRLGKRPADDLNNLVKAQAFSMIQLQPGSIFAAPSPFWDAIAENYSLEHQDKNGLFLIPRR